jgi:hypothetical protein
VSDNDHKHEQYDVYGLEDLATSVRRAEANAQQALHQAARLSEDLAAAELRIGRLSDRVQVLEAEHDAA